MRKVAILPHPGELVCAIETSAILSCSQRSSWSAAVAVLHQQVERLRLDGNRLGAKAQLAPVGIKRMIGKGKLRFCAANRTAKPPQGIIKLISRTNQAPGKVFPPRSWHPAYSSIAIPALAMERRRP
jgi:hypothetical protein